MKKISFAILLIFSFAAHCLTPKEIYKKSLSYVGLVKTPIDLGTGFFLENRIFATNKHVIKEASENDITVEMADGAKFSKPMIIYINEHEDLALLYFKDAPSGLKISLDYEVGEKIFALGNPSKGEMVMSYSLSEGIISRIHQINTTQTIQFTAPILPGSSGSPVLNEYSQVVGIVHSKLNGEQNFNFGTGSKNILSAMKITHELLNSYSALNKECPSFASSCHKLGLLLSEAGLYNESVIVMEKACKKGLIKACVEARTTELTQIGKLDIDSYKNEIDTLCKRNDIQSCQILKLFSANSNLVDNVLSLQDFDVLFPKYFKLYHKNVWPLVKDKVVSILSENNEYTIGGWATKKSLLTGSTSPKTYTFIEKKKIDESIINLFKSISVNDLAETIRKNEESDIRKQGKEGIVSVERIKKTFPYSFVLKTDFESGLIKKDLFVLGDSQEMLTISYTGKKNEEGNINYFIKNTLKGLRLKTKAPVIVFDAGKKFRVIGYWIAGIMAGLFAIIYIFKKRHYILLKLTKKRIASYV